MRVCVRACVRAYVRACVRVCAHRGPGLCDEEELGEGTVEGQQHRDARRVLAQSGLHGDKQLPQRPQQHQLTGPTAPAGNGS